MQNVEPRAIESKDHRPYEDELFNKYVRQHLGMDMHGLNINTIQVNIGLRCNLACRHCHVKSSPRRTEEMDWATMQMVLDAAEKAGAGTIDITGGAPEVNPCFRRFIDTALSRNLNIIVRTNLAIMNSHGHDDLPEYFAENRVHLVASLPCYIESNVDKQRGKYVYRDCIHVLQELNALGYGINSGLNLDLVYNPGGPFLPPAQSELENIYRIEMARQGVHFTNLYAITTVRLKIP